MMKDLRQIDKDLGDLKSAVEYVRTIMMNEMNSM